MIFCEKLDCLMKITDTSNSALALCVRLDPSHISRLRHGLRSPIRDEPCIDAMSAFFARRCKANYQKNALQELLGESVAPDEAALRGQIRNWLMNDKTEERASAAFSSFAVDAAQTNPQHGEKAVSEEKAQVTVYYGKGSKRQAAEEFISTATAQEKTGTLLLFSDEAVEWLTDDAAFTARWALRMQELLRGGKRICIIHTVNRNLDEMSSAFRMWMPLYMTGLIEPYYCPRIRDGIFRRTLFVLPGVAAVVSSSVGESAECEATLFIRDPRMVKAYECEFSRFRALCRPLMQIFAAAERKEFLAALDAYESAPVNSVIQTGSLSLVTMPEPVWNGILARIGQQGKELKQCHRKRHERLLLQLETVAFCERIRLYSPEEVKKGKVSVALSEILLDRPLSYVPEEYIAHLEELSCLLKTYERFDVVFTDTEEEMPYTIYVRDETGALVEKNSAPTAAFLIREGNMTASFRDYMDVLSRQSPQKMSQDKESKLRRLQAYIQQLKKDLLT